MTKKFKTQTEWAKCRGGDVMRAVGVLYERDDDLVIVTVGEIREVCTLERAWDIVTDCDQFADVYVGGERISDEERGCLSRALEAVIDASGT